jgi:hypothetical protein
MSARTIARAALLAALVAGLALSGMALARSVDLKEGSVSGEKPAARDIQDTIWFQGFVADATSGEPINATYTVIAEILDSSLNGGNVWGPETHNATVITDGWFNIELGSIASPLPAFDDPPYFLELTINGEVLGPRLKLASVPSAFRASSSDIELTLPYQETVNSGSKAFDITQTGNAICGDFDIDNVSSSAAALYGRHNGIGPAVLGWSDGSGPAIKGVATTDGRAGEFQGSVTIEDTLRVGTFIVSERHAAVAGTLLTSGFMMSEGAEEGYVLTCQDSWFGQGVWEPLPRVLLDRHSESALTTIGSSPTQYDDSEVTLTIPGPGYVAVEADVWVAISHTETVADKLLLGISTSPTELPTHIEAITGWVIPSTWPSGTPERTLYVHNTFRETSAGTKTYYLVGEMMWGQDAGDQFRYSHMRAVYYPD